MNKLKLRNNKGEIATTLTVLSLFVMLAGVFVGGYNKPNTIQNRASETGCTYSAEISVTKDITSGNAITHSKFKSSDNNNSLLSIINDQNQPSTLSTDSEASYSTTDYKFKGDLGSSNPYARDAHAAVTLKGLDTKKWKVKDFKCIQKNGSTKGCDYGVHASGDKLTLSNFHIACNVDISYGWIVEPLDSAAPTPTSLVQRITPPAAQPIPTDSKLPVFPTGTRRSIPGDPTPTLATDQPPLSKVVSGTVNLKGPLPTGTRTIVVSIMGFSPGGLIQQETLTIPQTYNYVTGANLPYRMTVVAPANGMQVVLNSVLGKTPNNVTNAQISMTQCSGTAVTDIKCNFANPASGSNLTASFNVVFTPDQVGQPPVVKTKNIRGKISWTGNIPVGKLFRINYNCTVGTDKGFTCSEQKWVTPDVKKTSVDYVIPNANVGGDDNRVEITLTGFSGSAFPVGTSVTALGCAKQGRYPNDCLIENVNNISGDVLQDFQVGFPTAGQCNFASITQITDASGKALPDFAQPELWSYANNKGGTEKFPDMFRSSYTSEKVLSASDDYVISDGREGGVDYKRGDQLFWTLKYDPIQYRLLGNNIRVCDYNADKNSITGTNCQDNTNTSGNLISTAPATVDCNKKIIGGWWFEKLPPTPTPTPQAQYGDLEILSAVTESQSDVDTSSRQGVLNKINTAKSGFYQLRTTTNTKGDYTVIIKGSGGEFRSNTPTGGFRRFSHIPVGTYQITYDLGSRGSSVEITSKTKLVADGVVVEPNKTTEATIVWKGKTGIRLETETVCKPNCEDRGECGPVLGGSTVLCAIKSHRGGAEEGCWCTNEAYCKSKSAYDPILGQGQWQGDADNGTCSIKGDGHCCLGSGAKLTCAQRNLPEGCKDGERKAPGGNPGGGPGGSCFSTTTCTYNDGLKCYRGTCTTQECLNQPAPKKNLGCSYVSACGVAPVEVYCSTGAPIGGGQGGGTLPPPPPVGGNTAECNAAGGGCTIRQDCLSQDGGQIVAQGSCSSLGAGNICCKFPRVTPPPVSGNTVACNAAGGGCTIRQDCLSQDGGQIVAQGSCSSLGARNVCCKISGVTPPPAGGPVTGPDCPTDRRCGLVEGEGRTLKCKNVVGKQGYCCPDAKPDWDGSQCVEKKDPVTGADCPALRHCGLDNSGGKSLKCKTPVNTQGYCCPDSAPDWNGSRCVARTGGVVPTVPVVPTGVVPPPPGDLSCLDKYPGVQAKLNAALEDANSKCNLIPNIDLGKMSYSCDLHKESGPDNDHYKCDVHGEGAFDWNPGACIDALENVSKIVINEIYDPVCRAAVFASKAIAGCVNDGTGAVRASYDELTSALNNKVKNTVLWGDVDVAVKDACLNPPKKVCSGGCLVTEYSTRFSACASTVTAYKEKLPNVWNAMKSAASSCGARFGGWSANIGIENGSDLPITQVTVSMCDENDVCQDRVQDVSIQPGQKSTVQTSVTQMVSDEQINDKYTLTCKLTYADGSTGDCPSSETRLNTSVSMKLETGATGEVTGDALSSLQGSDCDGDNVVTSIDYTKMTFNYGKTGDAAQCDTDLSGGVDAIDMSNIVRHLNEQVVLPDSSTTNQTSQ